MLPIGRPATCRLTITTTGKSEAVTTDVRAEAMTEARAIARPGAETVAIDADRLSLPALLRLQSWMSPAFPTGAYTFSHGLESAITDGAVSGADGVRDWVRAVIEHGSGRNDAIVTAACHAALTSGRADALADINALSLALSAGAERRRESVLLGASFRKAAAPWFAPPAKCAVETRDPLSSLDGDCALPVAIGALTARAGLPLRPVLASALQSTAATLAWIAARLVPLGQSETLATIAALEPLVARLAEAAASSTLDDLGGCAVLADIDSLRHERQRSRVCRS